MHFNIPKLCSIKYCKKKYSAWTCISVFFRGFIAIVSDEDPRSGVNAMLWSIYLETSELFIYKCLTSRHRLGFPRLFSRFLFFSFSCRVIYARPGYTVVGAATENGVMRGRTGPKCKGRKPRGRTFALPVQRAVAVAT